MKDRKRAFGWAALAAAIVFLVLLFLPVFPADASTSFMIIVTVSSMLMIAVPTYFINS